MGTELAEQVARRSSLYLGVLCLCGGLAGLILTAALTLAGTPGLSPLHVLANATWYLCVLGVGIFAFVRLLSGAS